MYCPHIGLHGVTATITPVCAEIGVIGVPISYCQYHVVNITLSICVARFFNPYFQGAPICRQCPPTIKALSQVPQLPWTQPWGTWLHSSALWGPHNGVHSMLAQILHNFERVHYQRHYLFYVKIWDWWMGVTTSQWPDHNKVSRIYFVLRDFEVLTARLRIVTDRNCVMRFRSRYFGIWCWFFGSFWFSPRSVVLLLGR